MQEKSYQGKRKSWVQISVASSSSLIMSLTAFIENYSVKYYCNNTEQLSTAVKEWPGMQAVEDQGSSGAPTGQQLWWRFCHTTVIRDQITPSSHQVVWVAVSLQSFPCVFCNVNIFPLRYNVSKHHFTGWRIHWSLLKWSNSYPLHGISFLLHDFLSMLRA